MLIEIFPHLQRSVEAEEEGGLRIKKKIKKKSQNKRSVANCARGIETKYRMSKTHVDANYAVGVRERFECV